MNPANRSGGRLLSVDVLRGLTMAAMIVVNNPGAWSAMYPWLRHAAWREPLLPADQIFPTFLLLVGISTPLALGRRRVAGLESGPILAAAARRAAILFAIGIGLNLYPAFDLAGLRIPGVLQRIALVYLACAVVFLRWGVRGALAGAAGLLAGYTALLAFVPVPGAGGPVISSQTSLPAWLDDLILGSHTWHGPGDPEGILSTLPAIASGLIGVVAGGFLARRPSPLPAGRRLAAAGICLLLPGWAWSLRLPAVKELWTAPYVLITSGWGLLALAACMLAIDATGWRRGLTPLQVLGRRALTAFVAAHLLSDTAIGVIRWSTGDGGSLSLHHFIQRRLLASWLPAEAASLVQSLLMLALIAAVLTIRDARRRSEPR